MKHVVGDLLELFKQGEFDIIVHGCNCGHNFGDGLAKSIRQQFPEAYKADLETPIWAHSKKGDYSFAETPHGIIVNAYTQFWWSGAGPKGGPLCEYDAVKKVFAKLKRLHGGEGLRFGIPAIGAARAGGDWNVISKIIDTEMEGEDVTFVEYNGVDAPRGNWRKNMKQATA